MKRNVGGLDEGIRITLGPILLFVAVLSLRGRIRLRPGLMALAAAVGAILTVTGLMGRCPANAALGRDTYRLVEADLEDDDGEAARLVRERALG
ncbi:MULTISPECIES: YgaP family membrane protein [Halorussus]|uniref:YgaP family membrane protein n=1 Tax=Halorussus TaxID=1070314 RepID=UPI00209E39F1|nr:DUF2892 domain-containing protein [Halorussus vallis]USZ76830.1 DUF2892 domain-containing protein [Halorussus vallis]